MLHFGFPCSALVNRFGLLLVLPFGFPCGELVNRIGITPTVDPTVESFGWCVSVCSRNMKLGHLVSGFQVPFTQELLTRMC